MFITSRADFRKMLVISAFTSFAFWGIISLFTTPWLLLIPTISCVIGLIKLNTTAVFLFPDDRTADDDAAGTVITQALLEYRKNV